MADTSDYSRLFSILDDTVRKFVIEVRKSKLDMMVTKEWDVKDILCHIVFWHNYYADVYGALAAGREPEVIEWSETLNQDGVDKLKRKTRGDLLASLSRSQSKLYQSIVIKEVPKMTYKVGREYKTESFLRVVISHIGKHAAQIRAVREAGG